jgi:hypothetical protein
MPSLYFKDGNFECKLGNLDLPLTTMVYNFESQKNCSGRASGNCRVEEICYAQDPERQYPNVFPYRERQAEFWAKTTVKGFLRKVSKIPFTTFRFGESGEIATQEYLDKLNEIAHSLLKNRGIVTYGYSCMHNLNFAGSAARIKLSGYPMKEGTTGSTMVIGKNDPTPEGWHRCDGKAGKCTRCNICTLDRVVNIAMVKH